MFRSFIMLYRPMSGIQKVRISYMKCKLITALRKSLRSAAILSLGRKKHVVLLRRQSSLCE